MDFKSALPFFEGSIFSDEYLGDFAKIRQHLQLLTLQTAQNSEDPEQIAWIKFLESIFAMLTGNLTKAFEFLREISLIKDLPPRWSLRVTAYNAFYTSLRLYPAIIRFRPNLGGPTAVFRTEELGFREKGDALSKILSEFIDADLPGWRFEARVLRFLLTNSLLLGFAYSQHPSYARGPWDSRKAKLLSQLVGRANVSKAIRDQALHLGLYQLDKYLSRLQVEIEYGKSPGRSEWVEVVKSRMRTFVDKHNLAIIKLIEGDNTISPPFANPTSLNLLLIEDNSLGDSITTWDSVEEKLKLGDIGAAGQLYQQAFDLFTDSASPRGCAAVLLRQACVEHMRAFAAGVPIEEKNQRCEAARHKLAESLCLFELDEAHSQIVRGHQILLTITSGGERGIIKEAAEIGRWGRASSNEEVSRFVGILMQRFGRSQMLRYGRGQVALKCFKCAEALFTSLGDHCGLFRALSSELYLHHNNGDRLAARGMVDRPIKVFQEVFEYFEKMEKQHPSTKDECLVLRSDMIMIFGNLVNSTYHESGDTIALEKWKKYMNDLNKGKAKSDTVDGWISDKNHHKYLFYDKDHLHNSASILNFPDFSVRDDSFSTGLSSVLPHLLRIFMGNRPQASSEPKQSFSDYVNEGQDCAERYSEAITQWWADIREGDIDIAVKNMRGYIQQAAPGNIVSHPENFSPIFAAAGIGDFETSREILKKLLNPSWLNSDVTLASADEGTSLQTSEDKLQESYTFDNVLSACAFSQDWTLGLRVVEKVRKIYPKFVDMDCTSTKVWKRYACVGVIYERNNISLEAFAILLKAAQLVEQDRSFTSDPDARRGIFSTTIFAEIFSALARLCLHAAEFGLPVSILDKYTHKHLHAKTWQENALLFLEQAKARNLLDALTANPSDSTDAAARMNRARKRKLRMALLGLPKEEQTRAKKAELKARNAELKALEAELEGYEEEIDPLGMAIPTTNSIINSTDLYRAIADDELVIEVDFSTHGSTILGITSNGIEIAHQGRKNVIEMRDTVMRVMKLFKNYPKEKANNKVLITRAEVEAHLKEISDELILPLKDLILNKTHAIFIASSPLAAFPFSTLLMEGEPLFLRVAVSQAPSLTTLLHLWSSNESSNANEVFDKPVSVCTVAKAVNPQSRKKETLLFLAPIEAMIIGSQFDNWPLECSEMTRDAMESLIQRGNIDGAGTKDARRRILHVGTHGEYDSQNPWLSYISLKEKFRVLDLGQFRAKGHRSMDLIVFSACLSGMGEGTLGNDVLGFAQAMLERDCKAYIGALWVVDDQASMLLMVLFYQRLWNRVIGKSASSTNIAILWREAQLEVYNLTIDGARKLISDWGIILKGAEEDGHNPKSFVALWKDILEGILKSLEEVKPEKRLDLKHPFSWGPFVVVGYGGLTLGPSPK